MLNRSGKVVPKYTLGFNFCLLLIIVISITTIIRVEFMASDSRIRYNAGVDKVRKSDVISGMSKISISQFIQNIQRQSNNTAASTDVADNNSEFTVKTVEFIRRIGELNKSITSDNSSSIVIDDAKMESYNRFTDQWCASAEKLSTKIDKVSGVFTTVANSASYHINRVKDIGDSSINLSGLSNQLRHFTSQLRI